MKTGSWGTRDTQAVGGGGIWGQVQHIQRPISRRKKEGKNSNKDRNDKGGTKDTCVKKLERENTCVFLRRGKKQTERCRESMGDEKYS